MKTKITTLVLCLVLSLTIMAQRKTDAFFSSIDNNTRLSYLPVDMDEFSFESMSIYEQEVPIDNGLLVLATIAIIYMVFRLIFKLKEA